MLRHGIGVCLVILGLGAGPVAAAPDAGVADTGIPLAADPTVEVSGHVVDIGGRPVADLGIFATEAGSPRIRAWARSDRAGGFRMNVAAVPHDFAVKSPVWIATLVRRVSAQKVVIVVTRTFGEVPPATGLAQLQTWITVRVVAQTKVANDRGPVDPAHAIRTAKAGGWLGLLSGQILDETGTPLPGVVVLAADKDTKAAVASARSDRNGRFALATAAGVYLLSAQSPGLRLDRAKKQLSGQVDLVMAVDPRMESVLVSDRRILQFRINDSVWPEYVPPAAAWRELRFTYGINPDTFCPGDLLHGVHWRTEANSMIGVCSDATGCPLTVWQRQCKVPKFWWLHLLHAPPPSPGRTTHATYWLDMMAELQAVEAREAQAIAGGALSTVK